MDPAAVPVHLERVGRLNARGLNRGPSPLATTSASPSPFPAAFRSTTLNGLTRAVQFADKSRYGGRPLHGHENHTIVAIAHRCTGRGRPRCNCHDGSLGGRGRDPRLSRRCDTTFTRIGRPPRDSRRTRFERLPRPLKAISGSAPPKGWCDSTATGSSSSIERRLRPSPRATSNRWRLPPTARLWIGFRRHGLARLQAGQLTRWTTTEGLSGNEIVSLLTTPDGSVWAGAATQGLNRIRDGRVTTTAGRRVFRTTIATRSPSLPMAASSLGPRPAPSACPTRASHRSPSRRRSGRRRSWRSSKAMRAICGSARRRGLWHVEAGRQRRVHGRRRPAFR